MRKIIHCDCDCFFAAVEMRDFPEYRDVPLAIGGRSDRRGVIATCNYAARAFGVRSAMATGHAQKLCPDLVVIPGRMAEYKAVSAQIMNIYREVTDLIEPLSIDEAYLDVSDVTLHEGSATRIAQWLKTRVHAETGITISAGVAPNKFLAKVASDWRKPDGLYVIRPHEVELFVAALPVSKLHGVGAKTTEKLQRMGIKTCADLRSRSRQKLVEHFGRFGEQLYELARGIDDRPVVVSRERKSVSVEHTYPVDLPGLQECYAQLPDLVAELQTRFERYRERGLQGVFVKLKACDFTQTTIEQHTTHVSTDLLQALMAKGFERLNKPVRLLGVGFRLPDEENRAVEQLSLW